MRAINVIVGALTAWSAASLLPIKSILMWRFSAADNLTACGRVLGEATAHRLLTAEQTAEIKAEQREINNRLILCRNLLNPAVQESGIEPGVMEKIHQYHRSIVSSTNLLIETTATMPKARFSLAEEQLLRRFFFDLQHDLKLAGLMLKGSWRLPIREKVSNEEAVRNLTAKLPFEWQGFIWTALTIHAELFNMTGLLVSCRQKWLTTSEAERLEYGKKHPD